MSGACDCFNKLTARFAELKGAEYTCNSQAFGINSDTGEAALYPFSLRFVPVNKSRRLVAINTLPTHCCFCGAKITPEKQS